MVDSLFNANEKSIIEPMMFAEDFSFYQARVPAFFAMLGVRNEAVDHIYPLHHGRFNFDESVLEIGLDYYQRILEHLER
jgi:metal-dependent amidase/aminoacylase/carboxypeptidase family protein